MRLSRQRKRPDVAFNMTPMIDIVFLLIIFFMTVSQITRVNEEPVELPLQEGVEDVEPETYTVNIRSDGTIVISGRETDISEAVLFIGQEIAAKGGDPAALRVLIRCDRRATTDAPNELVRRLVDLGVRQVRVTVQATPGG
ncbi:MAG: biopolymer transporter ExbD [Pirellulaceae bacterium]|nr:biopolymer transporter ExbD [Planctomycetales bacterium]